MLLPSTLAVVESEKMIGLQRLDGVLHLHVPKGMAGMAPAAALALLYKALVVFRGTQRALERLDALDGVEAVPQAGADVGADSFTFRDALALDTLFEHTDPMRLLGLSETRASTHRDTHLHIERNWHQALFDEDGAPYLERAVGRRRELRYQTGDIVGLYCFIAEDFYVRFLHEDLETVWGSFAGEGVALAADFRHRYLTPEASLYAGEAARCEELAELLRHILQMVDRNTPFRYGAYREIHEALYGYLHAGIDGAAKDGLVWGVKDFWAVWESACLVHALDRQTSDILTCDMEHLPVLLVVPEQRQAWLQQRALLFSRNGIHRRPDLVLADVDGVKVVDFKYYAYMRQRRRTADGDDIDKIEKDYLSMEAYGLLLQNHFLLNADPRATTVSLEFWLPGSEAGRQPSRQQPPWNPPLSVVHLPAVELLRGYVALYPRLRQMR
ncbi:hypothetical protein [Janthinobacterium sp. 1_2014MBL_MicDiv]|uniref:hypothetical protein n=1 Tax=Janthinobacterium sp. 1_2014MBL_MicDiv TaxID=1644131 RepID=UPI0008F51A43|nr:hypothetical protein [Janthinobacterium sp. 1_2014MBL_MicDiv]APA71023.1 hypothetical protein YQ44_27965 [Janthinobacterium sp. 1_2014MBL_MicDiv]